jgi:mono/diheme cytochrome c family protein
VTSKVIHQPRIEWAMIAMALIVLETIGCEPANPPLPVPIPVEPSVPIPAEPSVANPVEPSEANPVEPSEAISIEPSEAIPDEPNAAIAIEPSIASRTIWEGVYTEEQRLRGEAVYASSCVRCHGEELERDDAIPELVGENFLHRWSRKRAGNLFAFMKQEMPPKAEDRLTPAEYADVLAYLLSKNQAPVGEQELPSNFAALQAIRMANSE